MSHEELKQELEDLKKRVLEVESEYPSFQDIPMNHEYWKWKVRVRYLESVGIRIGE